MSFKGQGHGSGRGSGDGGGGFEGGGGGGGGKSGLTRYQMQQKGKQGQSHVRIQGQLERASGINQKGSLDRE